MRAAVLAGGLGTRLRPYTTVLPKPLVPLGARPILEWILGWLAEHGVEEVDVCVGHQGQLIQTYFSQPGTVPDGLRLHWRWEREPMGTAGALRSIPALTEPLLVVNGDVVTDLDPHELMEFHRARAASLTVAYRETEVATDLGVIEHRNGLVVGYDEKPVLRYPASIGVYVFEPRVVAELPERALQFPELVLGLLGRGERVGAYPTRASWTHIGTPRQHVEAAQIVVESEHGLSWREPPAS